MSETDRLLINGESSRTSSNSMSLMKTLKIVTCIISVLTLVVMVILSSVVLSKTVDTKKIANRIVDPATETLPETFVVPYTARTPTKDQGKRGTCWIFSTMGVLEGSYRKNGYEKGYLKEDEYVAFSEQAYGIGLVDYCQKSNDKYCSGGPIKGVTSDGESAWMYYMGYNVTKHVLPTSVCPYQSNEDYQFECPDHEKAVEEAPIKFTIKGIESAYSLDAIKRLIYHKKTPLAWSHSVVQITYTTPCSDPANPLADSDDCTECRHPCKQSAYGCCSETIIPGYTQQGIFATFNKAALSGGHDMLLLGWNDNFRVDTGLPGYRGKATVGGFIIKNSWNSSMAHSAEYWAQQHSTLDENFICPCEASSNTWLPVDAECMKENVDVLNCSKDVYKRVLDKWVYGATVLKCKPQVTSEKARSLGYGECNPKMNYALACESGKSNIPKVTVSPDSDGVMQFHLVEWDPENKEAGVREIITNQSTWYGIENIFTPVNISGNTDNCGIFFMPYETFLESTATFPAAGHDTPGATYFDIEWDKSSYLKNAKKDTYSYELLEKATYHYKPPTFEGPFDVEATTRN